MARIVKLDISAALIGVNHEVILYKPCFMSIGSNVLSILTQFLSNISQHVVVVYCLTKLINEEFTSLVVNRL